MFEFPDNCITEASRGPFCLCYQERQHELCAAGLITEEERSTLVSAMLPRLREAIEEAENGRYPRGVPPWVVSKLDWDGEKINQPPGLDSKHKGAIWSHAKRVMRLNMDHPDIDKISAEVGKAREVCLHDPFWVDYINKMWLEAYTDGQI